MSVPRLLPRGLRAFVGRFTIAFGIACLALGSALFTVEDYISKQLDKIPRIEVATAQAPPGGANYLLVGSDSRQFVDSVEEASAFGSAQSEAGQRSDTIMVVHVEPKAKRTLIVSFPRDLLVQIPGTGGRNKINSAFNAPNGGGADRLVETIKANFGIDVHHYLQVDFQGFEGIVNAIGTVPINFPFQTRDQLSGLEGIGPGCIQVPGDVALGYVRSRTMEYFDPATKRWKPVDVIPDISRIGRQQDFIRGLMDIAVRESLASPLGVGRRILDRIHEYFTLDNQVSNSEIQQLFLAFRTVDPKNPSTVEFATFPWKEGPTFGGQSVLYPRTTDADAKDLIAWLNDFSGDQPAPPSVVPSQVKVEVRNGSGRAGLAAATQSQLGKLGFLDGGTGDDSRGKVLESEIRYAPGARDGAKLVLDYVDPAAKLVEDAALRNQGPGVVLVLGTAFTRIVVPASAASAAAPAGTKAVAVSPATVRTATTVAPAPVLSDYPMPSVGC